MTSASILVLTLMASVSLTVAKIGFIKDQSMDAVFPGPVFQADKDLPVGHNRPLGWQRKTDGPVEEHEDMPNTKEFFENFVDKNLPAVFRNGVKDAPAFTTWADDNYLSTKHGNHNVTVRQRLARHRDCIVYEESLVKLKKFLFDYMYDELYLASYLSDELMEELPLPKCVRCGTIAENLLNAQLWMSSGGTSSRLHSHDDHLMHCVLFGRRDFIIIRDKFKGYFGEYHHDYLDSLGGHSDMDANQVNMFRFKKVNKVQWKWSTLYPGDCIFVPAGYLHQVRSYGRSVSITIEFAPTPTFDDTGCMLTEEEFVPLTDAIYLMKIENGEKRLTDLDMGPEEARSLLLMLLGRNTALTEEKFIQFYNDLFNEEKGVLPATDVFDYMRHKTVVSQLTWGDIKSLKSEQLQKVAKAFNEAHVKKAKAREEREKAKNIPRSKVYRGPKQEL